MYAEAVTLSGGSPFEIPLAQNRSSLSDVLTTCTGFVLPGSPADVDPARYGQRYQGSATPDPLRESTDAAILTHAQIRLAPVLGICYGMQSINVYYGGTLIQDVARGAVDHSAGPSVPIAHSVTIESSSMLASTTSPTSTEKPGPRRFLVNSSHHQAVATTGKGLRVTAWSAEDGIPEAIELDEHNPAWKNWFLLAVQWHPERSFETSPESRALFHLLVQNAAAGSGVAASVKYTTVRSGVGR